MPKGKGKVVCVCECGRVLFLFSHQKEENIGMVWAWWSLLGQNSQARKGNKGWWGSAKFGTVLPHLDLKTKE